MLSTYHKSHLLATQQSVYEELCCGIENQSNNIPVRYVEGLFDVMSAINYDHPEFFYVNWLDRISYTTLRGQAYVQINYIYGKDEIAALNAQIKAIAREIPGISTYGKAYSIHDWFVKNVMYDHGGLKQAIRSPGMFSAAGPLVHKKAVCEGISKLACCLMREKGVDATTVTGMGQSGNPHAWNLLSVDGKDLYMDITYDMGLSIGKEIQRTYFLLSRAEIAKDHLMNYF